MKLFIYFCNLNNPALSLPQREIQAKTTFVEKLEIQNWLSRQQRLRVAIEVTKPDRDDRAISIKGRDHIDLKANETAVYDLEVKSLREVTIAAKITFKNQITEEFIIYNVQYRVTPSEKVEVISLATQAR